MDRNIPVCQSWQGASWRYQLHTSVPSEQAFSIAGQILTKRRSAMTESMINASRCTKNWSGLQEFTKEGPDIERGILSRFQELALDGDTALED